MQFSPIPSRLKDALLSPPARCPWRTLPIWQTEYRPPTAGLKDTWWGAGGEKRREGLHRRGSLP